MAAEPDGSLPDLSVEPDAPEEHVVDDENYSHKRRLRAIHNAHDRVVEVRNAVEERVINGQMSEYRARRFYRGAVESFIMEVMPVLKSDRIDLSRDYADGVELGEVVISPPEPMVEYARQHIGRLPPGAGVPTPVRRDVVGLSAILDLPSPLTHRFSIAVQQGRDDVDYFSDEVAAEIPRDVLDDAVQLTAEALTDARMGLNIGADRPHNRLGTGDGKWPWQTDEVLPHEVHDWIVNGDITRSQLEALAESNQEVPPDD